MAPRVVLCFSAASLMAVPYDQPRRPTAVSHDRDGTTPSGTTKRSRVGAHLLKTVRPVALGGNNTSPHWYEQNVVQAFWRTRPVTLEPGFIRQCITETKREPGKGREPGKEKSDLQVSL